MQRKRQILNSMVEGGFNSGLMSLKHMIWWKQSGVFEEGDEKSAQSLVLEAFSERTQREGVETRET